MLQLVKNQVPENFNQSKMSNSDIDKQLLMYKDKITEKELQLADLFEFMTVLNQQGDRIATYMTEVSTLLSSCKIDMSKDYKSIIEKFVENEQTKQKIMSNLELTEKEKAELLLQQEALEKSVLDLKMKMNSLVSEKTGIISKKNQLGNEYKELSIGIKAIEKDITDLNTNISNLKMSIKPQKTKLEDGNKVKEIASKTLLLTQDIISLFMKENDIQQKINPILKEQAQLESLKLEYSRLVEKASNDKKLYQSKTLEINNLNSKIDSLKKTVNENQTELPRLVSNYKDLVNQKEILEKEASESSKLAVKKKQEIAKYEAEISKLNNEISKLKSQEIKDEKIENLKLNLQRKKEELFALNKKLDDGRRFALPDQLQREINEIMTIADKRRLQIAFQEKLNDIIEKYEKKFRQVESELATRKSQDIVTRNIITRLNEENKKISMSLDQAQLKIKEYKSKCMTMDHSKIISNGAKSLLKSQVKMTEDDLKKCKSNLLLLVEKFKNDKDNVQLQNLMKLISYGDVVDKWTIEDANYEACSIGNDILLK